MSLAYDCNVDLKNNFDFEKLQLFWKIFNIVNQKDLVKIEKEIFF